MALSAPHALAFDASVTAPAFLHCGSSQWRPIQLIKSLKPKRDANAEAVGTETRPDLVWDNEAPGLCVRCYGDGAKSFIFVYRIGDRQRFIRIGKTPMWSLETARVRAKELRSIVEKGRDPAREYRGREIPPVESIIQYIAENLVTKP
jgi:hypothetical protein